MFQLILGGSGHGKTQKIREIMCNLATTDKKLMLIVPDQFTFLTEKAILSMAGIQNRNKINVWNFGNISDEVFRQYGGVKEKILDDTGKIILMSLAIKNCKDQMKIYGQSSDKLTNLMIDIVDEFKANLITPETIEAIAHKTTGNLKNKAHDIALIYSAYDAMISGVYLDKGDFLTKAGAIINRENFFKDSVVIFDGFETFNKQKLEIIISAMRQSDQCYVTMCGNSVHASETNVFEPINKTAGKLAFLAKENNVEMKNPVLLKNLTRFNNGELEFLEENFLKGEFNTWDAEPENVKIFQGKTVYDETDFVASTIRKMVIDDELKYGDFSVICRNPEKYYSAIRTAFDKWDVPCYFSEPRRVDFQPLIRFVISTFQTIQKGFQTSDVLTMLKTNIPWITAEELSNLENYIYTWRINGSAWREPFTKHPKGFGEEFTEEDEVFLRDLNEARERIVSPILRLKESTKNNTGREISEAVYNYLIEIKADEKVVENSKKYEESGRLELSQESIKIWQKLMEVLDKFAVIFADTFVSFKEYVNYFKDVLGGEETNDIPLKLDTVLFGTAQVIKQEGTKVTFVIGAVGGDFPKIPTEGGIFSDNERKNLMAMDLPLDVQLEEQTKMEKFISYTAITGASDKVFLSYHLSHGGSDLVPSEMVHEVVRLFPKIQVIETLPKEYYISTYQSAFSALSENTRDKSDLYMTLKDVFKDNESYQGRIDSLTRITNEDKYQIRNQELAEKMFGQMYISATQAETYHRCAFQYFCKYGLKARERTRAEIDVREYGTLVHYLFEKIFNGDFKKYAESEVTLKKDIQALIKEYVEEKMGGFKTLSNRDIFRFKRMTETAVTIISHMVEELSQSQFNPKYFELKLENGTAFPPLKVKNQQGKYVQIGGVIDRVDVYSDENQDYIRVLDYKTGKKEFKLVDVLEGLNLQMLIYLAALVQSGKVKPAGLLYVPSSMPNVSSDIRLTQDKVDNERGKELRMNGAILDNVEIIEAMEKGSKGKFIPTGITAKGKLTRPENALNEIQLNEIFDYTKSLIATMANSLLNGKIAPNPAMNNTNSCTWCPYGSVCLVPKDDREKKKVTAKNEVVIDIMKKSKEVQ